MLIIERKSSDNKYLHKQLICEVEKAIKDFEERKIKTHEEVFSKFNEPIYIHKMSDEEFNDKMK